MRTSFRIVAITLSLAGAGCTSSQSGQRQATPGVGSTPVKHDRVPLSQRNRMRSQERDIEVYDKMTRSEGGIVR